MEKIQTVEIEYYDPLETYTANIQKNGDVWIGWMPEFPEIKCEENSQEELIKAIEKRLHEVLKSEYDEWCKQVEKDINAGKLDHILKQVDEDIRLGRCKDL